MLTVSIPLREDVSLRRRINPGRRCDKVIQGFPREERVMTEADFSGHVSEANKGDEEVMEKFNVQDRDAA